MARSRAKMPWNPWRHGEFPPPSRPRAVRGGIKARSQRGAFSQTWWSRRWIEVLEGFGWSARLQRGRRYARLGQVMDLQVAPGRIEARVQGSRREPYEVRIAVAPLSDRTWKRVLARLGARAGFAAALLAGELPETAEAEFRSAHASLLPTHGREFESDCSCPDWANPCKHIAAVHYLLGEWMDRDPFVLLALRGRPKAQMLAELRAHLSPAVPRRAPHRTTRNASDLPALPVELPADPRRFWGDPEKILSVPSPALRAPMVPDAILRRLGEPAFLRGSPELTALLRNAYARVGERALALTSGGSAADPTPPSVGIRAASPERHTSTLRAPPPAPATPTLSRGGRGASTRRSVASAGTRRSPSAHRKGKRCGSPTASGA